MRNESVNVNSAQNHYQQLSPTPSRIRPIVIAQAATGAIGILASSIYFGPALWCAQAETCGAWLSKMVSEKGAHGILFTAGIVDFGGINAYFAVDSVPRASTYVLRQTTATKKCLAAAGLTFLTLTQTVQMAISCIGTNAQVLPSVLAVLGTVPGALYGVAGMMDIEIPFLFRNVHAHFNQLYAKGVACFRSPKPEGEAQLLQYLYYEHQQKKLIVQANANWRYIVAHSRSLTVDDYKNLTPLEFLFEHSAPLVKPVTTETIIRCLNNMLAAVVVVIFSLPFGLNSLHTLERYIANDIAAWAITILLGTASLYGNFKITLNLFNSTLDFIKQLFNHEPLDSLALQLNTQRTLLAFVTAAVFAAPSYTIANLLMASDYDGPFKPELSVIAMVGTCLYHFNGLLHFYNILWHRLCKNDMANFLFQTEEELYALKRFSVNEFQQRVENDESDFGRKIRVSTFAEAKAQGVDLGVMKKSRSAWNLWCCFNKKPQDIALSNAELAEVLVQPAPL